MSNGRSEATRARLLAAAVDDLVARDGTLEVATVAARAGVSTGAIYHHFGSKAGLVSALVHDFHARLTREVIAPSLAEHGGWAARERARIERTVAFHYGDRVSAVLATLAREPEVAAAEAPFMEELVTAAERNLRAAQRDGEIAADLDPGIAAAVIMGGIRYAVLRALSRTEGDRPDRAALAEELWRLVSSAVHYAPVAAGERR